MSMSEGLEKKILQIVNRDKIVKLVISAPSN